MTMTLNLRGTLTLLTRPIDDRAALFIAVWTLAPLLTLLPRSAGPHDPTKDGFALAHVSITTLDDEKPPKLQWAGDPNPYGEDRKPRAETPTRRLRSCRLDLRAVQG